MLQDQSRNRTPMPGAQAPGAAPPDTGPARAEAGIATMLSTTPEPEAALPIEPGLADACLAQVERMKRWDEDAREWTDEEGNAELVRYGAVFRRAVDEPSAGLTDLAAKARLMQDDMDRFLPADHYRTDNYRLLRVILREVVAMAPSHAPAAPSAALPAPSSPEALEAFGAACRAVDAASGDAAECAALKISAEGSQYWTSDVVEQAQMGNFSRVSPGAVEDELRDAMRGCKDQPPTATLAGAAWTGLFADIERIADAVPADSELIALGQHFDALHALWREAEADNREPGGRYRAALEAAEGLPGEEWAEAQRAAWELPGVAQAGTAADDAFAALDPVCRAIFSLPARSAAGVAVKARATIPGMWSAGGFEADASEGNNEDWEYRAVRQLIEACCAAAGVDWRGRPPRIVPAVTSNVGATPDPIFAALAEAQRLDAVWHAISAEWKLPTSEPPELEETRKAALHAFWDHWNETVLKTVPTTAAGCAALSRYVVEYLDRDKVDLNEGPEGVNHDVLRLIMRSPMLPAGQAETVAEA